MRKTCLLWRQVSWILSATANISIGRCKCPSRYHLTSINPVGNFEPEKCCVVKCVSYLLFCVVCGENSREALNTWLLKAARLTCVWSSCRDSHWSEKKMQNTFDVRMLVRCCFEIVWYFKVCTCVLWEWKHQKLLTLYVKVCF